MNEASDDNTAENNEPENAVINFKLAKQYLTQKPFEGCIGFNFPCDYKLFEPPNKYIVNIENLFKLNDENELDKAFLIQYAKFFLLIHFFTEKTKELNKELITELYGL